MSAYDKNINVGDIITSCHQGYHQVTAVEQRFYTDEDLVTQGEDDKPGNEYHSLIRYVTLVANPNPPFTDDGYPRCADASYCNKVTIQEVLGVREKMADKYNKIIDLIMQQVDDSKEADTIGGFPIIDPNCLGCREPLTLDNAWMTDGCPCSEPLGVNSMNETRWRLLMDLQQNQQRSL